MTLSIVMTAEPNNHSYTLWSTLRALRIDWRSYQRNTRPVTAKRLARSVQPRLDDAIFIVGAPRSGTTFLGSQLSNLPEVSYHYEPSPTKWAAARIYNGEWGYDEGQHFYRSWYGWLMRIHLDGDLVFAEKTPRNCFLVDFLAAAFPRSRFVHIIRDGRDVAVSLAKKPWLRSDAANELKFEPGGYRYGPFPRFWVEPERLEEFRSTSDIHRCIWSWRRHVEAAQRDAEALDDERYLEIRYEQLVEKPAEEVHRMLSFLGLSASAGVDGLLERVTTEAQRGSVGTWRDELGPGELRAILGEAKPLLRKLGYL